MRTKVVSFFIFFQELSNKKITKALRPKMTKIASGVLPTPSFQFLVIFAFLHHMRREASSMKTA